MNRESFFIFDAVLYWRFPNNPKSLSILTREFRAIVLIFMLYWNLCCARST